jgi:hypothetical protein
MLVHTISDGQLFFIFMLMERKKEGDSYKMEVVIKKGEN